MITEPTPLASLAASMRHMTPESLAQAASRIEPWHDLNALVCDVMGHVGAHLLAARAKGAKAAVLVGGMPTLQSGLMVELAAMQAVHRLHGTNAVLLIPHAPEAVQRFARGSVAKLQATLRDAGGEGAEALDLRLAAVLSRGEHRQRAAWHTAVKMHAALRLGFGVTGFDTQPDAPHARAREEAMVDAVAAQLADDNAPVIVAAARHHLPVLRDRLANAGHVIALAAADASIHCPSQSGAALARNSYALAHPAVKAFRASSRLEHEPLHYQRLASQLAGRPRVASSATWIR